ncbi:hypothetical protein CI109_102080 [Kwoniella shandongensis]|uniref:Uncharacterized protein n=1 Tax=Kwoniella shandongensis TaxID=1734106 RepID=A0A5M6BSZ6_9TREE|nr:uncharacterized protein CI109_006512 [Kwoniella shandongensis]KAA5525142.1 hypothetical protein CI109_006512 [Kwoniella shandongensis]
MPPFRSRGNATRGGRGGRGGRDGYAGPKLPSTLLDQVDATYGTGGKRRGELTRKERRKEERRGGPGPSSRGGRGGAGSQNGQNGSRPRPSSHHNDDENVEDEEEAEEEQPRRQAKSKSSKRDAAAEASSSMEPAKKKKKLPELRLPEQAVDETEEQEIEWLEWMLKKEKGKGKEEDDDGLDDLLDFANDIGPGGRGLKGKLGEEESDDEDEDMSDLDDENDDGMDLGSDEEEIDLDEDDSAGEEEVSDDDMEDDDDGDVGSDEPASEGGDKAIPDDEEEKPETTVTPSEPAAPTKYVPPHLRAAQLEEKARGNKEKNEERIRLERKAQGLLNKLSEANLESILAEIESLYRDHSRNDVSTALTTLIIQMISNRANLLDSFVVLYATLVGALHRVIGMEFGAHFVHTLIMRYHNLVTTPESDTTPLQATIYETPDASKESLNLLTLVAELYNAQVIGSKLIYDLIRGFLEDGDEVEIMGERQVEGLLKILRCSGAQLRIDDPASLKDIVNLVQEKTKGKEKTMTARARFMVETLTNVKNGKVKSNAGSEAGNEAAGRMKKFLSGLGRKRRLLAYEPLRVSLTDLLSADKKGKWWLVGAGWSGNPLVDREQQQTTSSTSSSLKTSKKKSGEKDVNDEEALLDLARKQGMNTDVRRGVFVVLMTSEDYVHACERMSMFKLTEIQQREFVRVTLHCCGLEKTYNAYYTLILNHLCANSYDHRFTLQYALWDFLRELEDGGSTTKVGKQRMENVAKAMAYVIARGSMDLTVFKAIDFSALSKNLTRFLVMFLINLFISLQTPSPIFSLPKKYNPLTDLDEDIIQEVFEKVLSNQESAGGWLWILEKEMRGSILDLGEGREREEVVVKRSKASAKSVLGGGGLV